MPTVPPVAHPLAPTRPRRRTAYLAAGLLAVVVASACGDRAERTNAAYCEAVRDRIALVATPAIATPDDVAATIAAYRDIVNRAPAAIEPEWQKLLDTLEAASAVDPGRSGVGGRSVGRGVGHCPIGSAHPAVHPADLRARHRHTTTAHQSGDSDVARRRFVIRRSRRASR